VQLEGFLAARQAGVQRFTLRLAHREGRSTQVVVGLVSPSRSADHFALLLRERLGGTPLIPAWTYGPSRADYTTTMSGFKFPTRTPASVDFLPDQLACPNFAICGRRTRIGCVD
jgi:hypothetical protein